MTPTEIPPFPGAPMTTAATSHELTTTGPRLVMVDGIAAYDYGGRGQDIVLLHGLGDDSAGWANFAGELIGRGFRPVAMDLRGHGASAAGEWTWSTVTQDLSTVINELGLRDPVVAGHSLGGMVASVWAAEHPECPFAVNIDGYPHPSPVS